MRRLIAAAAGFALSGYMVYQKRVEVIGIIAVLAYATVFSLLLSPVCTKLEKSGLSPALAAGGTVVGFFLIIFLLIAAIIPYLLMQSEYMIERISPAASGLMAWLMQWKERMGMIQTAFLDSGDTLGVMLSSVMGLLVRMGMSTAKQVGRIAFSLVLTYYVLCERRRIGSHLLLFVPLRWRNAVLYMLHACKNAMLGYLSGLLKTSAFVAAATYGGLFLLGVQDAFLLALIMGILEVLPYIGPLLAAVPILLSAMMQGAETALLTLLMLIVVQQIEGNFVSPYFTASSTSVHPLASILAVFVMGSLLGIWGILIAVPLLVLCQSAVHSISRMRSSLEDCMPADL